uniref:RWD domain-containing protein n=1 Tax=Setaria digitata TaxID=48799 RepID=A0A915PPN9_9BILA
MDHRETQIEELETLGVIYPDELEVVCNEYPNIALRISLQSHQDKELPHMFEVTVALRLSATYPDVVPEIEILGLENIFSCERIEKVQRTLYDVAQENLGMPMVFTIVSGLQDEIGHLVEDLQNEKIKAEEKAKEEKEAQERKKFEGTRVTPEAFMEWKRKFDTEMLAVEEKKRMIREAEMVGKMTGRQLFLRDATLNLSDVALMQVAGNEIEFDESLFDEVGVFTRWYYGTETL